MPQFTGQASDTGGSGIWKVDVSSDDGESATDADGTYYDVTLDTLDEGVHTVTATVFDVAGNSATSNSTVLVDRTAPIGSTPDLAAGSDTGDSNTDNITQGNTPQFTGTASDPWEAGVSSGVWKVEVASDDGTTASDSVDPFYDVTLANLPEGTRTVSTTVYDVAGNTYTTAALAVTVDRTAPAAPSTPDLTASSDMGMSDSDNITKQTWPMFEGTAERTRTLHRPFSTSMAAGSGWNRCLVGHGSWE
jgi:hypothetical protein